MRFFFDTEFHEDGQVIDLISIGVVREDGEEYYAETLFSKFEVEGLSELCNPWVRENVLPHLQGGDWVKSESLIAQEIDDFVGPGEPEFWAYCSAYDYVVLNQLYGPMVNHPKRWPFYCNDLAQYATHLGVNRRKLPPQDEVEHHALSDARWVRDAYAWLQTWRFASS